MDPWGVTVWNISKIHDGITHAHYVKIKKSHYIDIGIWGESVLKFCAQNEMDVEQGLFLWMIIS